MITSTRDKKISVFVSYSRKDSAFMERLVKRLEENGIPCWVDRKDIPSGSDWQATIGQGILDSDNFIFIETPDSLLSPNCNKELSYARINKKRTFPIFRRQLTAEQTVELHNLHINSNWGDNGINNIRYLNEHQRTTILRSESDECNDLKIEDEKCDKDSFENGFNQLTQALKQHRQYIATHTFLQTRSREWADKNRHDNYLIHANDLREALEWLEIGKQHQSDQKTGIPLPDDLIREFVDKSEKREIRTRNIGRSVLPLGIMLGVVLILLAVSSLALADQRKVAAQLESTGTAARDQLTGVEIITSNVKSTLAVLTDQAQGLSLAIAARQAVANGDNLKALDLVAQAASIPNLSPETKISLDDIAFAPGARLALTDVQSIATSMAVSSDGNFALVGGCRAPFSLHVDVKTCTAGVLTLWDLSNGKLIRKYMGHKGAVTSVAFSPDGKSALSGSTDRTLILWDLRLDDPTTDTCAEQCISKVLLGHISAITRVAFDLDGLTAISGGCGGVHGDLCMSAEFFHWNLQDGTGIKRFEDTENCKDSQPLNCVYDIAISPDSTSALTVSAGSRVLAWDLESYKQRIFQSPPKEAQVLTATFNLEGTSAVSLDSDGRLIQWDLNPDKAEEGIPCSYSCIKAILTGPQRVATTSLDLGKSELLTGTVDGHIQLWEINADNQGTLIGLNQRLNLSGHSDRVLGVHFMSPITAASLGGDNHLLQWDLMSASTLRVMPGHTDAVWAVEYSHDGKRILSGSWDQSMIVWDGNTGAKINQINYDANIWTVDITGDGKYGVSGSFDHSVILWDLSTGNRVREFSGHPNSINRVAFSADDTLLVSSSVQSGDGVIPSALYIWDVQSGKQLRELESPHVTTWRAAFSPDNKFVVAGADDGKARLWSVDSGKIVHTFLKQPEQVVPALFSPKGDSIVVGTSNGIYVWKTSDLNNVFQKLDGLSVAALAFSDDGSLLFATGNFTDETLGIPSGVVFWDTQTWKPLSVYRGRSKGAYPIAINPTNRFQIVTGLTDNSIPGDYLLNMRNVEVPSDLVEWIKQHRYLPDGK